MSQFGSGASATAEAHSGATAPLPPNLDGNSRGNPLHLAAVSAKSQPVARRNDSVSFSAGLAGLLSDGVTVAQRSLEPLVVVRIHVGQPLEDQRQTAGCIFVMLSFDSPRPLT